MLVYWLFVLIPAGLSLAESPVRSHPSFVRLGLLLLAALWLLLAFRETGGDYRTYLRTLEFYFDYSLIEWFGVTEPLYAALNWLALQLGGGIYFVNGVCALLFLQALYRFATREDAPLFLLTLAVPYLVIVVAMGYTRQGVATGFLMLALLALRDGRIVPYLFYIALGCGFHSSLAIFAALPVVANLGPGQNRTSVGWRVLLGIVALAALPSLFRERAGDYVEFYIEGDRYQSSGAVLRGAVTAVAAGAMLLFRRQWRARYEDFALWLPFALVSLANIPFAFVSSTASDRIGLYLIPFQILVFSRLPALAPNVVAGQQVKLMILVAYLAYFYVWLHLGTFAQELWVPYVWYFS